MGTNHSEINSPEFESELSEMLRAEGVRMAEQGARSQAMAAASMLGLLGGIDFGSLADEVREKRLYEVFRLCCYATAGMPVVHNALRVIYPELGTPEDRVAAVARMFGLLFRFDPEPLIRVMVLGE